MAAPISSSLSKLDMNTSSEFALTDGDIFSSNVQKKPSKFNLPITNHVKNNPFSWQGCGVQPILFPLPLLANSQISFLKYFQTVSRGFLNYFRRVGGGFQGGDTQLCPLGCLGFSAARFHGIRPLCSTLVPTPLPLTDAEAATLSRRLNTLPLLQRTTLQTIFRS